MLLLIYTSTDGVKAEFATDVWKINITVTLKHIWVIQTKWADACYRCNFLTEQIDRKTSRRSRQGNEHA